MQGHLNAKFFGGQIGYLSEINFFTASGPRFLLSPVSSSVLRFLSPIVDCSFALPFALLSSVQSIVSAALLLSPDLTHRELGCNQVVIATGAFGLRIPALLQSQPASANKLRARAVVQTPAELRRER